MTNLSKDGTATGAITSGTVGTITLVTTQPDDIIVVAFAENAITVSHNDSVAGITDNLASHLTWTKRASVLPTTSGIGVEYWYSQWSSSGTISIISTLNATGTVAIAACGLAGYSTPFSFDSNVNIPAEITGASATSNIVRVETSQAPDAVFYVVGWANGEAITDDAGFTTLVQNHIGTGTLGASVDIAFKTVSTVIPSLSTVATVSVTSAGKSVTYGDAFQQPPIPPAPASGAGTFRGTHALVVSGRGVGTGQFVGTHSLVASGHGIGQGQFIGTHSAIASGRGAGSGTFSSSRQAIASGNRQGGGLFSSSLALRSAQQIHLFGGFSGTARFTEVYHLTLNENMSAGITAYSYAGASPNHIAGFVQEFGGTVSSSVQADPNVIKWNFEFP